MNRVSTRQALTNLYVNNPVPITPHYHALVFGLAFVDALDDERDVVDFLAIDGLVVVVFPRA